MRKQIPPGHWANICDRVEGKGADQLIVPELSTGTVPAQERDMAKNVAEFLRGCQQLSEMINQSALGQALLAYQHFCRRVDERLARF